jgi:hypothetical protein
MADKGKYSSHKKQDQNERDASIVEEQQIKEAEQILASPHKMDGTMSPQENDVDQILNSQSMSIIFQDLNENEIK